VADAVQMRRTAHVHALLSRRMNAEPTGVHRSREVVELLGRSFKVDRRGFIPRLIGPC